MYVNHNGFYSKNSPKCDNSGSIETRTGILVCVI